MKMAAAHREGLKVGVVAGLLTGAIGVVVIMLGLGAWGERKADKSEVRRIELLTLANEKRISLLELQAEQSLQVNTELLKILQERRAERRGEHDGG